MDSLGETLHPKFWEWLTLALQTIAPLPYLVKLLAVSDISSPYYSVSILTIIKLRERPSLHTYRMLMLIRLKSNRAAIVTNGLLSSFRSLDLQNILQLSIILLRGILLYRSLAWNLIVCTFSFKLVVIGIGFVLTILDESMIMLLLL